MKRTVAKQGRAKKKAPPKPRGRPSRFSPAVASKIVGGLSNGTPLTVICSPAGMPGIRTVYDWMEKDAGFSADIARARDCGFDAIASRLRETAREGGDSTGDVQRDKLIIETDLKLLAKWDPKRYGERITQEFSGPSGGPISTVHAFALAPQQEDALARLIEAKRAAITQGG
jgi:hypothetical protein